LTKVEDLSTYETSPNSETGDQGEEALRRTDVPFGHKVDNPSMIQLSANSETGITVRHLEVPTLGSQTGTWAHN